MLYTNNLRPKVQHQYQQNRSPQSEVGLDESSCSQCKRNAQGIREQEEQDEEQFANRRYRDLQSSQQDGQLSSPMRKLQTNRNHQFQEMLRSLRSQINILKKENETKDEIIKELKFHVHKSIVQQEKRKQTDRRMHTIDRVRQELGCSPRNQLLGYQKKGFRSVGKGKQFYNTARNFNKEYQQDTYSNRQNILQGFSSRAYKPYNEENIIPLSTIPQSHPLLTSQYQLKLALLEKQLSESQLKNLQQKQLLTRLEQENKWQQKFILSFVKMCDQLSLNYGEKLKLNIFGKDLKKMTKVSWNYMKGLIAYFIDSTVINGPNLQNHQQILL